ncbi:hypothetical protein [Shinella sp.]|uniref:hypothetical protein n=1 Tax=Shinella sp. TaxID=1870904 RepID=UPI0039E28EA5
MSDTTTHLELPKPNRAHVPPLNVDEEFDRLALAWDMVDAFLHALAQSVAQKAPAEHDQAMSTIIGLIDALNAKMSADRQFALDDLTDVDGAADAPVNWILVKGSGGKFVPSTALAALGVHPHLISEVTGLAAALTDRPTRSEVSEALDVLDADLQAEIMKRGVPLGTMVHSAVPLEAQGFLLADGSPCTSVTPDLRAALLAADSPFGNNGVDPLLPDEVTGNLFRRAAGGALVVGTVQNDAIRNITGTYAPYSGVGALRTGGPGIATGAFKIGPTTIASSPSGSGAAGTDVAFDASLVVPTADENRPKNIAYLPYIKAYGAITIEGMADLSALFNALATKAEAEVGADNTKLMTALRTKEAIDARKGRTGELTLSGTQFDVTGIPTDARRIRIKLNEVSFSAASTQPSIQIGTSAGVETSGYKTSAAIQASTASSTSTYTESFRLVGYSTTSGPQSGVMELDRIGSSDRWIMTASTKSSDASGALSSSGGYKSLSGHLDRLRITTAAGTATLSGSIEVEWEK